MRIPVFYWVRLNNGVTWHLILQDTHQLLCNGTPGVVDEKYRATKAMLGRTGPMPMACPPCLDNALNKVYTHLEREEIEKRWATTQSSGVTST